MRNKLIITAFYAATAQHKVRMATINVKHKIAEHRSEMATAVVTAAVVGVAAHAVGFNAGYEFAMNESNAQ